MRRRRLKKLWRRLAELQGRSNSRDQLMLKLGAAKKEAGRAWNLVDIRVPGTDKQLAADGYLHDIADGFTARRVIGEWIDFYNTERPHPALGGRTPAEAYRDDPPVDMMDKPLRALPPPPQAQQKQQKERLKGILVA